MFQKHYVAEHNNLEHTPQRQRQFPPTGRHYPTFEMKFK